MCHFDETTKQAVNETKTKVAVIEEKIIDSEKWAKLTYKKIESHIDNSEKWKAGLKDEIKEIIENKIQLSHLGCSETGRIDKVETNLLDLQGQIKSNTNVNETANAIKEYKRELKIKVTWWTGIITFILGTIYLLHRMKVIELY